MGRRQDREPPQTISGQAYIPTGSTLLNLALSDKWDGGWPAGKIANLIGDSSSGKTFLALTAFAEMARDKQFENHLLIFDDVEAASEFDMKSLFGARTAKRIQAPPHAKELAGSDTIQDFEVNIHLALDNGSPFLYILDSFDALTSEEEQDKTDKRVQAAIKGKAMETGSYGMEKAKKSGEILRKVKSRLSNNGSTLVIISQTRDNINPMSFTKKTRSGGKALKFYSTHELWTAVGGTIKRKDVPVGVLCKIKVTKNKLTGKVREVTVPIYYDYGLDDIESCVDWLVNNKHWTIQGRTIDASNVFPGVRATKEKLIALVESEGREKELSRFVGECWNQFEDSLKTNRKRRY